MGERPLAGQRQQAIAGDDDDVDGEEDEELLLREAQEMRQSDRKRREQPAPATSRRDGGTCPRSGTLLRSEKAVRHDDQDAEHEQQADDIGDDAVIERGHEGV